MNLETITVTEFVNAIRVYSRKGDFDTMRNRTCYGLSLCESGKITYVQDGIKYISTENMAIILPQGGNYEIYRQETGFFPVINFRCAEPLTDTIRLIPTDAAPQLLELFGRLQEHFLFGERLDAMSVLYAIFSLLDRGRNDSQPSRALQFIHRNLADPALSNSSVAAYLHMSETGFTRAFRQETGTSPKQYILKARMENAKRYLSENRYNIAEIAEKCGYSSIYSFSRAFKFYTGQTPTEYKRQTRLSYL